MTNRKSRAATIKRRARKLSAAWSSGCIDLRQVEALSLEFCDKSDGFAFGEGARFSKALVLASNFDESKTKRKGGQFASKGGEDGEKKEMKRGAGGVGPKDLVEVRKAKGREAKSGKSEKFVKGKAPKKDEGDKSKMFAKAAANMDDNSLEDRINSGSNSPDIQKALENEFERRESGDKGKRKMKLGVKSKLVKGAIGVAAAKKAKKLAMAGEVALFKKATGQKKKKKKLSMAGEIKKSDQNKLARSDSRKKPSRQKIGFSLSFKPAKLFKR